jgi:L-threonylcarbamoyladenylate synthase
VTIYQVEGIPDAAVLRQARTCIGAGGTLIFPTETVYGIGCAPEHDRAVEAIFEAKGRAGDKPLTIHVARPEDAYGFASRVSEAAQAIMLAFWPGPVAIVVQRRADRCIAAARNGPTIGLRCPADAACHAILNATGPLAATSANLSGKRAFTGEFGDGASLPEATMAIIAGPTSVRRESTVLDCSGESVRVLRAGALDVADIERALDGIALLMR